MLDCQTMAKHGDYQRPHGCESRNEGMNISQRSNRRRRKQSQKRDDALSNDLRIERRGGARRGLMRLGVMRLTTKTVQGPALALEGVDDVEGGDGLALGVLSVGDGVTDDTLEEGLEDTTGLVVDH
jgi:hypothetical protein